MKTGTLYDIKNLKHRYENNGAFSIKIDSLQIKEGSVTGLVGPNGSGKSTLLKVLAFLEPYAEGTLSFEGSDCKGREVDMRRAVTYLLQDSYLLKRTVYENIAYGLKLHGELNGMKKRIYSSMESVGLSPDIFAERPWYRLSGGEVQRVALATRLALHPRVLLLDEPTANVDESSAQLIKEAALSAWKEWGTTVIVATHDLGWLYEVSTDIVSLYRGQVVGHGAENIINGFWQVEEIYAVRNLSDGQKIYGSLSGGNSIQSCLVNPSEIMLTRTVPTNFPEINAIKGKVMQMVLERGTGCVLVSVDAGDITLKSRVTIQRIEEEAICPASTVWLIFSSNSIRWL